MPSLPQFNWIDLTNLPWGVENIQEQWLIERVENVLWGLFSRNSDSQLVLYHSTDAGLNWSLVDATCPLPYNVASAAPLLKLSLGADGKLHVVGCHQPGSSSGNFYHIDFTAYDIGGGTWDTVTGIGGGLPAYADDLGSGNKPGLHAFLRADGSRIILSQIKDSDTVHQVQVATESAGGAWTQLALLGGYAGGLIGDIVAISSAIQVGDVIHFFGWGHHFDNNLGVDTNRMWHRSVSAANVVSAEHVLETSIDGNISSFFGDSCSSNGRCDISADGTKIAYAYAVDGSDGYSTNAVKVHIAIGDISLTPLAPSFSIQTVATGVNPGIISSGTNAGVACSFAGTNTPHVYFLNGNVHASPKRADLLHSVNIGGASWSSPDFIWDHTASPAVQSISIGANSGLDGFDLLNALPNGTGILIDVFNLNGFVVDVGYIGPTLAPPPVRSYAHARLRLRGISLHGHALSA